MRSIQDEWSNDASAILAEIPKAVTVRRGAGSETSFNVLIGPPMINQDLETGGFLNTTSFDVKFLKSDAAAHPGVVIYGNLVRYNEQNFRIEAINDRPPSAWVIVRVASAAGPA
ncbi:hypothetical protein UFOVP201_26 [uncultured Caudovirales phage]|uniref:Uncharacterized protein n=1 Tax=uncultured Caudovirales phage TaxID=2100421 RepID=A0A6J7WIL3_9CAUD|nr:hypothetical protein UFOVP201_26 [uncultured Caudovirales phage]